MTRSMFIEKFHLLAEMAGAVPRLRELTLSLATRGALTRRCSADRSAATVLLEEASSTHGEERPGILRAPAWEPGNPKLPKGWEWVTVADVAEYGSRETVESSNIADDAWLLDLEDIERDSSRLLRRKRFGETPSRSTKRRFKKGDVLYGKLRPYLNKVLVADADGYCTTEIEPLSTHGSVKPEYLCLALRRPEFVAYAVSKSYGMNLPRLGSVDAKAAPIPLPPLDEQTRIVEKVDELMALCDRLEALQRERDARHDVLVSASLERFSADPTPTNLQLLFRRDTESEPVDLRRVVRSLAVRGKLSPQMPADEQVEHLLARCRVERLQAGQLNIDEPLSEEVGLGYSIPPSWVWQRLSQLLVSGPTNGLSPKSVDSDTGVRSLTLSATTSGYFKPQHSKFVDAEVPPESDLWLRDGDILVQRGNTIEYVGVPAVYRGQPRTFIYPDLMMRVRVAASLDVGYVHLAMSEHAARQFLRSKASGTAGTMPKINQSALRSLPIPVPPIAEQRRIVAKVQKFNLLIDRLQRQREAMNLCGVVLLDAVVAELTSARSSVPNHL